MTPAESQLSRTGARPSGRVWLVPAAVAVGAAAGLVLVAAAVRLPQTGREAAMPAAVPSLLVARIDALPAGSEVRERLRLLDPTPLFMPTGNGGAGPLAEEGPGERPSGAAGEAEPLALVFPDTNPTSALGRATPPASALAASERVGQTRWFRGMARGDSAPALRAEDPLRVVGAGRVDVYRMGEPGRVAQMELPPDERLSAETWRPVELSVLVAVAGTVASPQVLASSTSGEVDERVRTLVAKEVLPRLRLRPGSYRFVVGP